MTVGVVCAFMREAGPCDQAADRMVRKDGRDWPACPDCAVDHPVVGSLTTEE